MDRLTSFISSLKALFTRRRLDAELDEELHSDIELETEKNVRAGIDPQKAHRRALVRFGGVERYRERTRDARGLRWFEDASRDVRYAVRALARTPGTSLLVVLTLALAIGAGTTIYSVVSGVLLRSLPFRDPGRLVTVWIDPVKVSAGGNGASMSRRTVDVLRSPAGVFESAAPLTFDHPVLTGLGQPARPGALRVGPSFFRVLGTPLLLGSTITEADVKNDTHVVVVSHRFWIERLGGSSKAIGRTLDLDGQPYEVIGVAPAGFALPEGTSLWLPDPDLAGPPPTRPGSAPGDESWDLQGPYWLLARLASGVSMSEAEAHLKARFRVVSTTWKPVILPLYDEVVGAVRGPLLLLLGAVVLVLLVACANVAAVLLAQGIGRRREMAIRLSLGAGRGRVLRQLLMEPLVLALSSGVLGVALATFAVPGVVSLVGDQLPRVSDIGVNWRVLGVSLIAAVLTGLLSGLLPAAAAVREDPSEALKEGDAGTSTSRRRLHLGEALVVVQVALGTVLLAGGALLGLTFVKLMRVDLGFDPDQVVVASLRLPAASYPTDTAETAFVSQVLEKARATPGVRAAAVSSGIPFRGYAVGTVEVQGGPEEPPNTEVWFDGVTPDFFSVFGLRLLRGSAFPRSGPTGLGTIVVNQAFARMLFPGRDPLGHTVVYFGHTRKGRIVGVVSDARQASLAKPPPPHVYDTEVATSHLQISVRTAPHVTGVAAALRRAVHAVDPLLPIDQVAPLNDLIVQSVARQRLYAVVMAAFSLIALLIAALGMYGLTAYTVRSRTREIGIRMALGASRGHVRSTIVGRTGLLALLGVAFGLVGAALTTRLLKALLFGLSPTDPLVLVGVAAILAGVAVLAAMAPAARAARVDPMAVLHAE